MAIPCRKKRNENKIRKATKEEKEENTDREVCYFRVMS
jgi:hypothetical protein